MTHKEGGRNMGKKNKKEAYFMTGQLVALYVHTKDIKYREEYARRLKRIGFTTAEADRMFQYESHIMLDHWFYIPVLCDEQYLCKDWFDYEERRFDHSTHYCIRERCFVCSEITKIWDEAEQFVACEEKHDVPDGVWREMYWLSHVEGARLFVDYIKSMAENSGVAHEKVKKYSAAEQKLLFRYKWYPDGNIEDPYK